MFLLYLMQTGRKGDNLKKTAFFREGGLFEIVVLAFDVAVLFFSELAAGILAAVSTGVFGIISAAVSAGILCLVFAAVSAGIVHVVPAAVLGTVLSGIHGIGSVAVFAVFHITVIISHNAYLLFVHTNLLQD